MAEEARLDGWNALGWTAKHQASRVFQREALTAQQVISACHPSETKKPALGRLFRESEYFDRLYSTPTDFIFCFLILGNKVCRADCPESPVFARDRKLGKSAQSLSEWHF